jgi:hypothetical protein
VHLLAKQSVFLGVMIGVFHKRESSTIKWHQWCLVTRQLFYLSSHLHSTETGGRDRHASRHMHPVIPAHAGHQSEHSLDNHCTGAAANGSNYSLQCCSYDASLQQLPTKQTWATYLSSKTEIIRIQIRSVEWKGKEEGNCQSSGPDRKERKKKSSEHGMRSIEHRTRRAGVWLFCHSTVRHNSSKMCLAHKSHASSLPAWSVVRIYRTRSKRSRKEKKRADIRV